MQRSGIRDAVRIILVLTLVVVLALGLLYAYRSQTPAIPTVPVTKAIDDVQNDRVDSILISDGERATLTFLDGEREQTITSLAGSDPLLTAVDAYNRTKPGRTIAVRFDYAFFGGWPRPNVVLALIPMLFVVALVFLAAYAFARSRRSDAYEQLARIAELRDRGVLTEDEFQREKRRVLR